MNAALFPRVLLMVFLAAAFPASSFAHWDVGVTVDFAPPALPVYVQPPCPAPGYIWTPGYWAYANEDEDYYWVPGTWVLAPSPGLLWTPGYWVVADDAYAWREGYWAPHVGFYGGINYGFGYFGVGFAGGYWRDRDFYYNRAVTNVTNVNVTNVYNTTVVNNRFSGNHASFNGGDGVHARPTPTELVAAHEAHRGFTAPQRLQAQAARSVPGSLASVNHGHPSIAATARPGLFHGANVEPARHASNAPAMANRNSPNTPAHYYSMGRAGEPSRQSTHQLMPARAGTPQTAPRNERFMSNPQSAGMTLHGAPSRPAASNFNYRRPESQAPAASGSRPVSYRPAPAAPAYRPTPSYTPPRRAQQSVAGSERYATPQRVVQSTVRNEPYAMPQRAAQSTAMNEHYAMPQRAFSQAPRNEGNFRSAPAMRESGPAPMQDRRRSSRN